jgi:hypothetical protein
MFKIGRLDDCFSVLKGNSHFKKNADNNSNSTNQQRSLYTNSNLLSSTALSTITNQRQFNAGNSKFNCQPQFVSTNLNENYS